jgi:hypothetical protein
MKAVFCGILAILGAVALAGCGNSGHPQASGVAGGESQGVPVAVSPAGDIRTLEASVLASATPTGQPCSLDSIDGNYAKQVHVTAGTPHVFRGWLLDASRKPAEKFSLVLDGKQDFAIPASTGVSRPDVGDYLKDHALDTAGFAFTSKLKSIPPGEYRIVLKTIKGNQIFFCDADKTLVSN